MPHSSLQDLEQIRNTLTQRGISGGLQRQALQRTQLPELTRSLGTASAIRESERKQREEKAQRDQIVNLAQFQQQLSKRPPFGSGQRRSALPRLPEQVEPPLTLRALLGRNFDPNIPVERFAIEGPGLSQLGSRIPTRLEDIAKLFKEQFGAQAPIGIESNIPQILSQVRQQFPGQVMQLQPNRGLRR